MPRLTKEFRELANQINREFRTWDNIGSIPNDVRYAQNLLESFYDWSGKNIKNKSEANVRLVLTDDQLDEYENILLSIAQMNIETDYYFNDVDIERYKKMDKSHLNDMGIDTISKWLDFIDKLNRFKDDKLLSSIMSWYEYNELVSVGIQYSDLTEQEVKEKIITYYINTGLTGENLYEFILRNI